MFPVSIELRLKSYAEQIDRRLESLLPKETAEPAPLHEAMRYSCLAPGKRVRPLMCVGGALAVGGSAGSAFDAGCAIEFVHCFSLIHDDLPAVDNDDLRRGRPTCHKVFGEAIALLAGDALFALAFEVLAGLHATAEQRAACLQELAAASGTTGLVGGEVLDILGEGAQPSQEAVELIHVRKTAKLIAASCAIGGILGGATSQEVESLRSYGMEIGLAFQISDDVLNELGTPEVLGKAAGSDQARNKMTYPRIHGIKESQRLAAQRADAAVHHLVGLPGPLDLLRKLAFSCVDRTS